jgi:predicted aspartyl protease
MERLWKYVKVRGEKGSARVIALIDTGTPHSILPRQVAETVGTIPTGKTGTLRIKGASIRVQKHRADIEIASGGCRADVEVLVPEKATAKITAIIGSLFLQQTGAAIIYRGSHPVLCTDGPFTEESWSADFVPDVPRARSRRRRVSTSAPTPAGRPRRTVAHGPPTTSRA